MIYNGRGKIKEGRVSIIENHTPISFDQQAQVSQGHTSRKEN